MEYPKIIQDGDIRLEKINPTFENARRAGFVREGVRRQSYMFRNDLRDESTDVAVYSKLKSEWEKENKNA